MEISRGEVHGICELAHQSVVSGSFNSHESRGTNTRIGHASKF